VNVRHWTFAGPAVCLHDLTREEFEHLKVRDERRSEMGERVYWSAFATRKGARLEVLLFTDEPPAE
jgi:hypothetical protein